MKKIVTTFAMLALCASTAFASNAVRISQIYGGGGNFGAVYTYDYVELFNNSGNAVDISGWSLQYGSAGGTADMGTCTNCLTVFPQGSVIPACGYFLVQLAAGSTPVQDLPVTPDLVIPQATANNMGAASGKIALQNSSTTGPCGTTTWVDEVGWGTANCSETAPAGGLSNTAMAVRNGGGTIDTDNNSADFTVVNAAVPHNSQSPANTECLATPAMQKSWGNIKSLYR